MQNRTKRHYTDAVALTLALTKAIHGMPLTQDDKDSLETHLRAIQEGPLARAFQAYRDTFSREQLPKLYTLLEPTCEISYTKEKDFDGWYWWHKRTLHPLKDAPIPMAHIDRDEWGKARRKKTCIAKAWMLAKAFKAKPEK